MNRSLGSGLSNVKYFSEASAAAERIREVIKRVPKIDSDNLEGQILQNVSGEVEFRHTAFAYPSRPESVIFEDFNLTIPSGKTVALVGGSGSGKSTVIALLQRFYDPLGGEILLDGVAIDKLQLKWLRWQMGLVSQEPALFATSIKENILFGKEDASMEEVIEAAKASNAHNFITQLPQGYDTQVFLAPRLLFISRAISCSISNYDVIYTIGKKHSALSKLKWAYLVCDNASAVCKLLFAITFALRTRYVLSRAPKKMLLPNLRG